MDVSYQRRDLVNACLRTVTCCSLVAFLEPLVSYLPTPSKERIFALLILSLQFIAMSNLPCPLLSSLPVFAVTQTATDKR